MNQKDKTEVSIAQMKIQLENHKDQIGRFFSLIESENRWKEGTSLIIKSIQNHVEEFDKKLSVHDEAIFNGAAGGMMMKLDRVEQALIVSKKDFDRLEEKISEDFERMSQSLTATKRSYRWRIETLISIAALVVAAIAMFFR